VIYVRTTESIRFVAAGPVSPRQESAGTVIGPESDPARGTSFHPRDLIPAAGPHSARCLIRPGASSCLQPHRARSLIRQGTRAILIEL